MHFLCFSHSVTHIRGHRRLFWCSQEIVDKCHESLGGTMLAETNIVEQLHTVAATLGVPLTIAATKKSSKKVGDGDGRRLNKKGGAPKRVQRSLDEKIK